MTANNQGLDAHEFGFDPSYGYTLNDLLQIKAPSEPKDFNSFWLTRYTQALTLDPAPEVTDTHQVQSGWRILDIRYRSSDDFPIQGWLLLPESGIIRRGFIIGHGYGGRHEPDFHWPFRDAALLFPCFRGLSRSSRPPISTEPHWHVLHDIDKVNQYILGGCVADIWLGVSALLSLFPQLHGHLGYSGISFGGGVGALALASEKRIARAHLNLPTFGHHPLRLRLKTQGSANSVQNYYRTHKKNTLKVLQYYDAAVAASRITIPMHCACALADPCVAPPGQFAIYNALNGNKELYLLDLGHHHYPRQKDQEDELIKQLETFFQPLGTAT